MSFFDWLSQQVTRTDRIGIFARYAVADKVFPRSAWRLGLFLLRYEGMPEQRAGVKLAHREWRQCRQQGRRQLKTQEARDATDL